MGQVTSVEIVSLDEVCARRSDLGTIACTSGGFDPLHPGHVKLLLAAKEYCDTFVVFVSSDVFLTKNKKKVRPFMEHPIRCALVAGIRGVDYVIPYENEEDGTISNGLRKLQPHVFLKGGDRVDRNTIPEWPLCEDLGIRVVVPDHCRDTTTIGAINCHSSFFLDRWIKDSVAALEAENRRLHALLNAHGVIA